MADPSYIDADGVLTDGEAWVGIATNTVSGGSTALVTFTNPDDGSSLDWSQFMDLVLISYVRNGDGAANTMQMNLNNDTGANYAIQNLYGDGANATAYANATATYFDFCWYPNTSHTANIFGCSVTHLFDINSGKYKTGMAQIADDNDGSGYVAISTTTWKNQSPITEIDIKDWSGDNLAAGSRFDLFGVLPRMVS